jgi:actin-related protein
MSFNSGDNVGAIVADIGSFASRIGFAGDDMPKAYFSSVSYFYLCLLFIFI